MACPVELGQLEGEGRTARRTPESRGTFRQCSPQPGAAAGSGFPLLVLQKPPLPGLPTFCPPAVTRWLTPPPCPRGGQAAACLHPTLGHARAEDQRERRTLRMAWFPTDGVKLQGAPQPMPWGPAQAAPHSALAGSHVGCTRLQLKTLQETPPAPGCHFSSRRPCSKQLPSVLR